MPTRQMLALGYQNANRQLGSRYRTACKPSKSEQTEDNCQT